MEKCIKINSINTRFQTLTHYCIKLQYIHTNIYVCDFILLEGQSWHQFIMFLSVIKKIKRFFNLIAIRISIIQSIFYETYSYGKTITWQYHHHITISSSHGIRHYMAISSSLGIKHHMSKSSYSYIVF